MYGACLKTRMSSTTLWSILQSVNTSLTNNPNGNDDLLFDLPEGHVVDFSIIRMSLFERRTDFLIGHMG
jgi:hypothetical protein